MHLMEEFEASQAFRSKQEIVYRDPLVSMPPPPPVPSQETYFAERNYIGEATKLELLLEIKEALVSRMDDPEHKAQLKKEIEKLKKQLTKIKESEK